MQRQCKEWSRWLEHSSDVRTRHGIAKAYRPWTSRPAVHLTGCPQTPRMHDMLDVGFAMRQQLCPPGTPTSDLVRKYYAEVTTSVHRNPWRLGAPHVYRQNSYCYSYEHDQVPSE